MARKPVWDKGLRLDTLMVPLHRSFLSLVRIKVSLHCSFLYHWGWIKVSLHRSFLSLVRIKVPLHRSFLSPRERIKVRGK